MAPHIRGFFSYSREDDEAEFSGLTKLRENIERELAMRLGLSGKDVELFQDVEKLRTGNDWEKRLRAAVTESHFFVLVSTPRSFRSDSFTRKELGWFLEREKILGDSELVMPLAYLPIVGIEHSNSADIYADALKRRQYRRWDHLRHIDERDPLRRSEVDSLARDICDALGRLKLISASPRVVEVRSSNATEEASQIDGVALTEASALQQRSTVVQSVPEIIVDPYGRADCTTIKEAITKATNGERIVVRKGYYYEELVIDRPVEIIGSGARHEVVVTSTAASVVAFNTNFGRIAGLTLRNRSLKHYSVDIVQGRLQLENCDLTSEGMAIISVHNGADPIVSQCNIHHGHQSGILVFDKGRGTYEDNDIHGNISSGVEVTTEADPVFRRNRIYDAKQSGIHIWNKGRGVFEDNDIHDNALSNISVKTEADPLVRHNHIHSGKENGIFVYEGARGTYEDNDIHGNELSGIEVKSEAIPMIRRNRIYDGKQSGVYVHDKGKGTFEDNDIHNNGLSNFAVRTEANPLVRRNRIFDGKGSGLYIYEKGAGTYEDNDIHNNVLAGIGVAYEGDPIARRNRIHSDNDDGVFVYKDGKGTFESNIIEGNRDLGIRLADDVTPILKDNTVRNNAGDNKQSTPS